MRLEKTLLLAALAGLPFAAQAATTACVASGGSNCSSLIPDAPQNAVTSQLTVASGSCNTVSDVNVGVKLLHTRVSDLQLELTHVTTGRKVVLLQGSVTPGCDGDDINATFDDQGTNNAQTACSGTIPAKGGTLKPYQGLSTFNGIDGSGAWQLKVQDLAGGEYGAIDDWSVTLVCNSVSQTFGTAVMPSAAVTVAETAGDLTLEVQRVGGSQGAVSVGYAVTGGSATSGLDFTASDGTLNWANGDAAPKSITVTILADALAEWPETLTVALVSPQGGLLLGTPSSTTVTIASSRLDAPAITLTPTSLPDGQVRSAYSQGLSAGGGTGPYSYIVRSGALPTGLTLDGALGLISGTPSAAGVYSFTIDAADSTLGANGGPYAGSRSYTVTIADTIAVPLFAPWLLWAMGGALAALGAGVLRRRR